MNKFYIYSVIIHSLILGGIFKINTLQKDELKFIEKKSMTISLKNRKAMSSKNKVIKIANKSESIEKDELPIEPIKSKEPKQEKKIKPVNISKNKVKKLKKKDTHNTQLKKYKKKQHSTERKYNVFQDKNKFLVGEDGIFTAINLEGIEYEILKEVDPMYPIKARKIGYKGNSEVVVEFLVNLKGDIENINFISGNIKYGFKEEVFKALQQWKFKPIEYKEKKIKVRFEKTFIFKQ